MNKNGRNESNLPTPSQFHALIRQSAVSRGMATPETNEEFVLVEKNIDPSELPQHDFQEVLKLIEAGELPESKIISFPVTIVNTEVVKEFAQAARNGKVIPEEIRRKMDMDRAVAEQERRRNK